MYALGPCSPLMRSRSFLGNVQQALMGNTEAAVRQSEQYGRLSFDKGRPLASPRVDFASASRALLGNGEQGEVVWIELVVKDTGVGVPPEKQPLLFRPFCQVSSSVAAKNAGTGLGLVITKLLVELMRGVVTFQSTEGEGSTFTAHIPFLRADTDAVVAATDYVTTQFRDKSGNVHVRGSACLTPGQVDIRGSSVPIHELRKAAGSARVLLAIDRQSQRAAVARTLLCIGVAARAIDEFGNLAPADLADLGGPADLSRDGGDETAEAILAALGVSGGQAKGSAAACATGEPPGAGAGSSGAESRRRQRRFSAPSIVGSALRSLAEHLAEAAMPAACMEGRPFASLREAFASLTSHPAPAAAPKRPSQPLSEREGCYTEENGGTQLRRHSLPAAQCLVGPSDLTGPATTDDRSSTPDSSVAGPVVPQRRMSTPATVLGDRMSVLPLDLSSGLSVNEYYSAGGRGRRRSEINRGSAGAAALSTEAGSFDLQENLKWAASGGRGGRGPSRRLSSNAGSFPPARPRPVPTAVSEYAQATAASAAAAAAEEAETATQAAAGRLSAATIPPPAAEPAHPRPAAGAETAAVPRASRVQGRFSTGAIPHKSSRRRMSTGNLIEGAPKLTVNWPQQLPTRASAQDMAPTFRPPPPLRVSSSLSAGRPCARPSWTPGPEPSAEEIAAFSRRFERLGGLGNIQSPEAFEAAVLSAMQQTDRVVVIIDCTHLLTLFEAGLAVPHPGCTFVVLGRTRDREVLKGRVGSDSEGSVLFLGKPLKPGALWEAVGSALLGVEPGSAAATRASSFVSVASSGRSVRSKLSAGSRAGLARSGSGGQSGGGGRWGAESSSGAEATGERTTFSGASGSDSEAWRMGSGPLTAACNSIVNIFGPGDSPQGDSEDERRRRAEEELFRSGGSGTESGFDSEAPAPMNSPHQRPPLPLYPGASSPARPPQASHSRDTAGILAGLGISSASEQLSGGAAAVVTRAHLQQSEAAPEGTSDVSAMARAVPLQNGGIGRVLCAEDNAVNQAVARAVLRRCGVGEMDIVGDGEQAFEAVEGCTGAGGYHLILMDMQMPVCDGIEATRRIRALEARRGAAEALPFRAFVVALTANTSREEDQEACRLAGMDDFLTKPITPESVRKMLERYRGRRALD